MTQLIVVMSRWVKVFCLNGHGSENNDLEKNHDDCLEDDRMEEEFEEMGA